MNFEDEEYIRVYSRNTATTKRLGWEGRTVLWHLGRIVPKSGVLELEEGDDLVEVVAALCDLPEDITKVGLGRLASRGVTVRHAASLEIVRFVEAQNAKRSDRLRAQDYRDRQKVEALVLSEKKADASRGVTARHDSSLLASPLPALPCPATEEDILEVAPAEVTGARADAQAVFEAWKLNTGHPRAKFDRKREARLIARLRDGFTREQLLLVIKNWRNDPWLTGEDSGHTWDGIETLFRDCAQVERLVDLTEPIVTPVGHRLQKTNGHAPMQGDHGHTGFEGTHRTSFKGAAQ